MRGNIKITVEIKEDSGRFPVTETYVIGRDNTYEGIGEWVVVFRKILYLVGFHSNTIDELLEGE